MFLKNHMILIVLINVVFMYNFVSNLPTENEAQTFPGLDDEIYISPDMNSVLKYRHYSGYLQSRNQTYLHYWFFESQSSNSSNDPVVLWLNGGPGCSSLIGAMTGVGPLKLTPNGSLIKNPFSWNLNANLLFLESPAQVGFSYQFDPPPDLKLNDNTTAEINFEALHSFYRKFPHLTQNDLYLTGESYAGIYIPTLSMLILEHNFPMNFKGIALGNAYLDYELGFGSRFEHAYKMGLISKETWDDLVQECCPVNYYKLRECVLYNFTMYENKPKPVACYRKLNSATGYLNSLSISAYDIRQNCSNGTCFKKYDNLVEWFNRDKVQRDLKISHPETTKMQWKMCNKYYDKNRYDQNVKSVRDMVHRLLERKIKVLLYFGDLDTMCNYVAGERFIDDLNLTTTSVTSQLTPYYYENQTIGYIKQFPQGLTYVKILDAGHDVLSYKPEPMLKIFRDFVIQSRPKTVSKTGTFGPQNLSIYVQIGLKLIGLLSSV